MSVNSGTSNSVTFDANGNMTSDGTNSYSWDAANRLIEIVYPGTGNNSQFAYDGLGHNAQILEYTSSSLTNTKMFVWCGHKRCEARDSGGSITSQYFPLGEVISGSYFLYAPDHTGFTATMVVPLMQLFQIEGNSVVFNPLSYTGSVREMTNSGGVIQDERAYDPYGRVTRLQGVVASDFQFAGYYFHNSSNLSMTVNRPYSSAQGRFINRDPIEELGGTNLYAYVRNDPVDASDPQGLYDLKFCLFHCGVCEGSKLGDCILKAKTPGGAVSCIIRYGGSYAKCLYKCIVNDQL